MSSSPRFQLKPATGIDFPSLIDLLWTSFESPLQGILRLFFPILDNDHPRSLQTCIDGQLEEYRTNQPQLMWVKVVDMQENERIVAGAKWFFYDRDPHGRTHSSEQGENSDKDKHEVANANADEETHLVADWYPEGIAREFATEAARQFERPREVMARGAHAFLHIAYTHPSYRNRGLAHLFLDWGLRIADERGLECWLDASDMGAPLYEKFGFRRILKNLVNPVPRENLTQEERREWMACEETILPIAYTVMWRPKGGVFVEGETRVPSMD